MVRCGEEISVSTNKSGFVFARLIHIIKNYFLFLFSCLSFSNKRGGNLLLSFLCLPKLSKVLVKMCHIGWSILFYLINQNPFPNCTSFFQSIQLFGCRWYLIYTYGLYMCVYGYCIMKYHIRGCIGIQICRIAHVMILYILGLKKIIHSLLYTLSCRMYYYPFKLLKMCMLTKSIIETWRKDTAMIPFFSSPV